MNKIAAIAVLMVAALADATVAADISTLESGTYFAQGSMFARSYRVFGKENGRACVKIVDGPPNPYEGFQNITVSTVVTLSG
jgi:hypothetical protein